MRNSIANKLLVLVIMTLLWLGFSMPHSVLGKEGSKIDQIFGTTEFDTAEQIAERLQPGITEGVILVSSHSYSDILASIPLSIQKNYPLLYVDRIPENSTQAFDYIKNHTDEKSNIYIIGGKGIIPESFEAALQGLGFNTVQIRRIGGYDQYETAVKIAQLINHDGSEFILTSGENSHQAIPSAALVAAHGSEGKATPILYLPQEGMPPTVLNYLNQVMSPVGTQRFHVVGNSTVIAEGTIDLLSKGTGLGRRVIDRISGKDTYELMAAVNKKAWVEKMSASGEKGVIDGVVVSTGGSYLDALPAAALASKIGSPLVLISKEFPNASASLLKEFYANNQTRNIQLTTLTIIGGPGVIPLTTLYEADAYYTLGESIIGRDQIWKYAVLETYSLPEFAVQNNEGALYVSDSLNHTIVVFRPDGVDFSYIGKVGEKDQYGAPQGKLVDGTINEAMFNQPKGLAYDNNTQVLYVADSGNGAIRFIDKAGNVKTLVNGLERPTDLVIGKDGFLYVTETLKHRILKVNLNGQWSVLAGGPAMKNGESVGAFADGKGEQAKFNEPQGLAMDQDGVLYVADSGNQRIRKVTHDGNVTTLAGSGEDLIRDTSYIVGGMTDGKGLSSQFNFPHAVAVGKDKTIYVSDTLNHSIRIITPEGYVKNIAGTGNSGNRDGMARIAEFERPIGLLLLNSGNLLIVDQGNRAIRQYVPAGK